MRVSSRLLLAAALLFTSGTRAATPEAVDAAVKRGVEYLYKQQRKNGCWENLVTPPTNVGMGNGVDDGQWGGRTALCTYALLAAGERALDPRMAKAVDWLREAPMTGNYALGVRANVWFYLPQTKANVAAMQKDAQLLAKGRSNSAKARNFGFFDYQPGGPRVDLSCSQYGVLGCWAAAQRVNAFDARFWSAMETSWSEQQNEDGGWGYSGRGASSTIQMTAAGVATLFITQELAHANDDADPQAANKMRVLDESLTRGLDYIAAELADHLKSPMLYALYGIERVGVASGQKYIGDVDWYRECTDVLLKIQAEDGSWPSDYGMDSEVNTSFALLFLSRGRAPVMVNKLQYDIVSKRATANGPTSRPADWNTRPRDIANVTRWVEERTERRLNWQSVKLSAAPVDDLHDAPLLYMTGRLPISLRDSDEAKLKQYIEEGGILVASTDSASAFGKTFRTLGEAMFPGLKFKPLDAKSDHVLVTGEQFPLSAQRRPVKMEVLDNGARVLMLFVGEGDLSIAYQRRDMIGRESAYQFMANAYLYAVEKTGRPTKGLTHVVRPDSATQPSKTATIARVKYAGGPHPNAWDPEPGGWRRLAAVLHNSADTNLTITPAAPGSLGRPTIAHLTGTGGFTLTDAERAGLKAYIQSGGLLLVDACGGDAAFDVSARAELAKLFPDAAAQLQSPLPADHPLLMDDKGKPMEVKYRDFALPVLGPQSKAFQLRGITVNDKLAVVYSPQDLSEGLVGQPVDGIVGYTPEVATNVVRRLIELRMAGKL